MATKQQLEANADRVIAAVEQAENPKEQFCIFWNGTIKPILELVKSFIGSI